MRILLINQFFHPDICATAQLATDLAEDLAARGHEVTALATAGTYLGGGARLPPIEHRRGVRIQRVRATSLGKATTANRLADYASYYGAAVGRALVDEVPEVTICMSTPPLIAALGAFAKWRGSRFVYWVQDLYPDIATALGVVSESGLTTRVMHALSRRVLCAADAIVTVGDRMRARIAAKGICGERIHVVPNWADGSAIRPVPPEANTFRKAHGLTGPVVMYSGNMGRAHDLETLLGMVRVMSAQGVTFVFVGDGTRRREIEAAARGSASVRILPYQARASLAESLSAGDVHLIGQRACAAGLMEPSKLYGILAAGRPVLYVGPRDTHVAGTILREGVGAVTPNGDVDAAVRALRGLVADAPRLGVLARAAFEREYDRPHRTGAFEAILRQVVEPCDWRLPAVAAPASWTL